jgi:hypothetical protein
MIDARIDGDSLEVQATGRDWWPNYGRGTPLAKRLRVRLPLEHITAARAAPPREHAMHQNVPVSAKWDGPGGLIWCRRGVPVLELHMDGPQYELVVVSVADPGQLADQIRNAVGVGER